MQLDEFTKKLSFTIQKFYTIYCLVTATQYIFFLMQRFAGRGWSTTRKVIAIGRNYAEHAKGLFFLSLRHIFFLFLTTN